MFARSATRTSSLFIEKRSTIWNTLPRKDLHTTMPKPEKVVSPCTFKAASLLSSSKWEDTKSALDLFVVAANQGDEEAMQSLVAIRTHRAAIPSLARAALLLETLLLEDPVLLQQVRQLATPLTLPSLLANTPGAAPHPPRARKKKIQYDRRSGPSLARSFKPQTTRIRTVPAMLRKPADSTLICPFCYEKVSVETLPAHLDATHNIHSGTRTSTPVENIRHPYAKHSCPVCMIWLETMQLKQHIQQMHPECLGNAGYIHFVQGGRGGGG